MDMDPEIAERIAEALERLATGLKYLGNGNAATEMGAIENLAKEVMEGSQRIAAAIEELAAAVDRGH
jgi:hypothetical protein